MDIQWLQRDFGLYIVNMFDTGQASRSLGLPKHSLAFLLQYCCGVKADKQFQLADWRIRLYSILIYSKFHGHLFIHPNMYHHVVETYAFNCVNEVVETRSYLSPRPRPLPSEMMKYAREDTHYLLYIYDRMSNELIRRANERGSLLRTVLDNSKGLCGLPYVKPAVTEDSYLKLYYRHKRNFNSQQVRHTVSIIILTITLHSHSCIASSCYSNGATIWAGLKMRALAMYYQTTCCSRYQRSFPGSPRAC